ncbi:hypothetical protein D8Y20_11470 [Mariprofundus sp. EBB-1]|uniref:hypothetical protein n=1 Tax=Mariprofundus sp. EBB-1 TaxID=2650971 RepID=UPI000EF201B1|nr:hypothetical protein [Mariprofundus sp. EBB-1]RLL50648.1 hypothetical protein D8Y20_11470 [Mariprofundus sp. EBB-1]
MAIIRNIIVGINDAPLTTMVSVLWPVSIVCMHFVIVEPIILPVLTFPLIAIWLIFNAKFDIYVLLCAFTCIVYAALLGGYSNDAIEFIKSFVLFFVFISMLLLVSKTKAINPMFFEVSVKIFIWLAVLVALLTLTQSIALNVFTNYSFMNPFGDFGRVGPGGQVYTPHPEALLKKSNAVFSEPSVCGWFLVLAAAIVIAWNRHRKSFHAAIPFVLLLGAVLTGALSGLFNAILLLLCWAYLTPNGFKGVLTKTLLYFLVISTVVGLLSFEPIAHRFGDIDLEGSSVYYRVVAPLMLLRDSLPEYPFGHALGQTDYIASKAYMVNWEGGKQFGIHNSFFLISYYFGIVGVIISCLCMYIVFRSILKKKCISLILLALMLVLLETGGLWSPEISLLLVYCTLLMKYFNQLDQPTCFQQEKP